jgi:hypothetical protein
MDAKADVTPLMSRTFCPLKLCAPSAKTSTILGPVPEPLAKLYMLATMRDGTLSAHVMLCCLKTSMSLRGRWVKLGVQLASRKADFKQN